MTDNMQQEVATPQTPPQVPQPPMTDEQRIEAIKNFLFSDLLKSYQEISTKIGNLPIDGNLKRIIVEKIDDAWLWMKEAFNVLQIQLHNNTQAKAEAPSKSQQKRHQAQKSKKR